ncbi:hypoxanthine phosphoribosyltransferase [Amycolatopsis vancoresmycina DSM 44592]|uniref:Hypoxanthine phosphoribosyltransferase n=1 Tax=Amycolatopsis vancoresmycina DSM 44592 TaxID=1292037 RepID=R1IEQ3_9PSEU|nr:hypoxanthine phosphoribosyltransferase [Amycolatopsis vancoresmycina DSM 44592]
MYEGEIASVLVTEQQIKDKIAELSEQIAADYPANGQGELLLVGVLKGAVMFMTDFARAARCRCRRSWNSWPCPRTARRLRRRVSCGS